jgi:hypothetical protein
MGVAPRGEEKATSSRSEAETFHESLLGWFLKSDHSPAAGNRE